MLGAGAHPVFCDLGMEIQREWACVPGTVSACPAAAGASDQKWGGSEPQKSVPPGSGDSSPRSRCRGLLSLLWLRGKVLAASSACGGYRCPSHPCLLCVSVSVRFCLLKGCLSLDSGPPDLRSFASQLQRPRCRVWGRTRAAFLGPHADHFTLSSILPHSCHNPEGDSLPWKCEFGSFLYVVDEPDVFICWGRLAA